MAIFSRDESQPNNRAARRANARARRPVSRQPISPQSLQQSFIPYDAGVTSGFATPRPLTAAAAQINLNDKGEADRFRTRRAGGSDSWQQEAWEYYDAIGEIKYAFSLVASVVSRIRLYAGFVEDPSQSPVAIRTSSLEDARLASAAERAIVRLDSAYGGQAGLLRDAALNLSVAGECYLVQMPERIGTGVPESWDIRSVDELRVDQRGAYTITPRGDLQHGSGQKTTGSIPLPKNSFVGRIWKAHPRYSDEADSSMRGILDLCAELLLLNRTFRATARSRLNAGALYLPDGLSVASGGELDYPYADEDQNTDFTPEEMEDEFEEQLIEAMTTPIRDEDSASAVVPLIIRGPAELGDKIKQFKFERSFDDSLVARADRVLDRIMQGIDVPKDVVTGLANVKYSNALQIDESLYKAHIEPLMLLIVDALTVVYLRPYLLANGFSPVDVERVVIWYDSSQVATRNDRAADADSGFEKMAVSFDSWRRAHGFSDSDAPNETELALRLLIDKGTVTPELSEALLRAFAPNAMDAAREASQAQSVGPMPDALQQVLQGGNPTAAPAPETEAPAPPPELAEPIQPTEEGSPDAG